MNAESQRIIVEDSAMSVFRRSGPEVAVDGGARRRRRSDLGLAHLEGRRQFGPHGRPLVPAAPLPHRNPQRIARYTALAASSSIY